MCGGAHVSCSDGHASYSGQLERVPSCVTVPGPLCVCVCVCVCVCIARVLTARTRWLSGQVYIGARRRVKDESNWMSEYLKAESTGDTPPEMPVGYDGGRTFLILLLLGPLGENMLSLKVFCTGGASKKTRAEKRALQARDTQRTLTAVAAGRGGAASFLRTDRPLDNHDKLVLQTMEATRTELSKMRCGLQLNSNVHTKQLLLANLRWVRSVTQRARAS